MTGWNQRAMDIFGEASVLADTAERERFLVEACGDDGEIRKHVDALLAANQRADDYHHSPRLLRLGHSLG